jgi:hypothetical protein
MEVQILADGRPVITTQQAAASHGYTLDGMRATLRQAHVRPVTKLDGRTPLYDPMEVAAALAGRPGIGAPGRPRKRRGGDHER